MSAASTIATKERTTDITIIHTARSIWHFSPIYQNELELEEQLENKILLNHKRLKIIKLSYSEKTT